MTKKYLKLGFIFLGLVCLLVFFVSSRRDNPLKYRETKLLMGTVVQIDACHAENQTQRVVQVYEQIWRRLTDIHERMGNYAENSEIIKINQAHARPVTISEDTYKLLKESLKFSSETRKTFDITVWPLINLWKDAEKNNAVPSAGQIKAVMASVGSENIRLLKNQQVQILNSDAQIDLSGIAKGFAVDEAARIFRQNGFKDFLIDAGGDIYVGGRNCKNKLWRIGIRDPRDKTKIIDILELSDVAVTTSGDYEQFYEIQNQRWSHIMNPLTGVPQKDVSSATVVAPKAAWADAWSTALCVLEPEEGIALVNSKGQNFAGIVIVRGEKDQLRRHESKQYKRMQLQNKMK